MRHTLSFILTVIIFIFSLKTFSAAKMKIETEMITLSNDEETILIHILPPSFDGSSAIHNHYSTHFENTNDYMTIITTDIGIFHLIIYKNIEHNHSHAIKPYEIIRVNIEE